MMLLRRCPHADSQRTGTAGETSGAAESHPESGGQTASGVAGHRGPLPEPLRAVHRLHPAVRPVGWMFGAHRLREHVNSVSSRKVGRSLDVSIKYAIPTALAVLFVSDLVKDVRQPYGGYPWTALLLIGRDWLLITLIAALFVAMRPWRKGSP